MNSIKTKLLNNSIFYAEENFLQKPSIVGYEKLFKWKWMATQLNTFIVVTDFGDQEITVDIIKNHLKESFSYASKNYKGWPRGFQSAIGVITVLKSSNISADAIEFCEKLRAGKKWAGFAIPVVANTATGNYHSFQKNPMWGRIYYPHFKNLITKLLN